MVSVSFLNKYPPILFPKYHNSHSFIKKFALNICIYDSQGKIFHLTGAVKSRNLVIKEVQYFPMNCKKEFNISNY